MDEDYLGQKCNMSYIYYLQLRGSLCSANIQGTIVQGKSSRKILVNSFNFDNIQFEELKDSIISKSIKISERKWVSLNNGDTAYLTLTLYCRK